MFGVHKPDTRPANTRNGGALAERCEGLSLFFTLLLPYDVGVLAKFQNEGQLDTGSGLVRALLAIVDLYLRIKKYLQLDARLRSHLFVSSTFPTLQFGTRSGAERS
ncbi:hypothetical protein NDU88_008486 [Pleurodeles waltl]|uniref:Uncharacterized protein n=1 Tax=Pleurodeles waltl TaxID=8319 RepID=A0AAV7N6U5_PLEWA|nr:hypothetical protein NDU88_008486 [Pleurodeles waltl]